MLLAFRLLWRTSLFLSPKWSFSTAALTFSFICLAPLSLPPPSVLLEHPVTFSNYRQPKKTKPVSQPSVSQPPAAISQPLPPRHPVSYSVPSFQCPHPPAPRPSPDVLLVRITNFLRRNVQFHSPVQHFDCATHIFGMLTRAPV